MLHRRCKAGEVFTSEGVLQENLGMKLKVTLAASAKIKTSLINRLKSSNKGTKAHGWSIITVRIPGFENRRLESAGKKQMLLNRKHLVDISLASLGECEETLGSVSQSNPKVDLG